MIVLKATQDKGLVFKPSGILTVAAVLDADFAALYGHKKVTDPACAKSCTGFLIQVSDCPMVWVSKLQTEIRLFQQWRLKLLLWLIAVESYFP